MYTKRLFVSRNPDVIGVERICNENNETWLARALGELALEDVKQWTLVVLVGGKDQLAFRLRLAQSHFRRDMLPSYWSECLLMETGGDIDQAKLHHVPLIQPRVPYAPCRNGLVETTINTFASVEDWPNIALLAYPKPEKKVVESLERLKEDRDSLDALSHVIRWLSFVWGANGASNPVHDGLGTPSACMVGSACAAAQIDVTPGMPVSGACPEVLWSSVNYWHQQVTANGRHEAGAKAVYQIGHCYDIDDNLAEDKA